MLFTWKSLKISENKLFNLYFELNIFQQKKTNKKLSQISLFFLSKEFLILTKTFLWIKYHFENLRVLPPPSNPIIIMCKTWTVLYGAY